MGLDITVMIVDWSWLGEAPPRERLSRLREAWYADETGLWDHDAPAVTGDWEWPRGPDAAFFAVYEFLRTCGSFKPHFWAGERWESLREHADPMVRTGLDTFLQGLIWDGPAGAAEHTDPGFFSDEPVASVDPVESLDPDEPGVSYGLLVGRSPDSVRELAAAWEGARPLLGGLRWAFDEHAADPAIRWFRDFEAFTGLLEEWGRILTEASRRGWGVVGLSE